MNATSSPSPRQVQLTIHPLSEDERLAEARVLEGNRQHFATSKGAPREIYDAMTRKTPIADGVATEEVSNDGVRGIWVRPTGASARRAILFVHGGAYMLGSASGYVGFASQIAVRTALPVFVLDYPLAPEQPFPAAGEAVLEARRWLATVGIDSLALMGDSAGGGLVLATLGQPIDASPLICSAVVFSPWTDLALESESMNSPGMHDPIFQKAMLASAANAYLAGADPKDPLASPLHGVAAGLPPLAIQVGEDELLLDDSRVYSQRAAAAGVAVKLDIYQGLHHVFQRAVAELPSARNALADAAAFVSRNW